MAKVVLFYPKLEENIEEGQRILLPMSILTVAAPLAAESVEVKIIDQRVTDNWQNVLMEELKKEPLIVGFSVLTGKQILYALEASKIVKENSKAFVVWGGVHPSLLPEQTLKNEMIDYLIIREGEKSFLELFRSLANKEDISKIKGIAWKDENKNIYINFLPINSDLTSFERRHQRLEINVFFSIQPSIW